MKTPRLTILASSLLTAVAFAAPDPAAFLMKRFQKLDLDHDGKLSKEEAAPIAALLEGADANKDGFLTPEEMQTFITTRVTEFMDAPAADGPAAPAFEISTKEAPQLLKAGDVGVGTRIAGATLTSLDGKAQDVFAGAAEKPVVVAMVSSSCPVSKRLVPTLARLEKEYAAKGVAFVLIAPTSTDSTDDLQAAFKSAGLTVPCLRDPKNEFLAALGARATTDAFVIDAGRTLIYRGAVDDQYGIGYSREAARHTYLKDALEATLAGRSPEIAATEAPGCALDLGAAKPAVTNVTYHNRISRLVQANCQECHRTGGVAPFALETYEQVTAKSGQMKKMVERGAMPPWFAAPVEGGHSPWKNDRSLAERDKADLLAWIAAGKPEGNKQDAPASRSWPKDWAIGTPDLIIPLPHPVDIKADGTMPYQILTTESVIQEDKWVRGYEIQPSAKEVVHHILVFAQIPGTNANGKPQFEGEQDERSGFFAAYVPGNSRHVFPEGCAKKLPAGTRLRFQIHYTPNGTATQDLTKIGLVFSKEAPQHSVRVAGIADHRLNIPPGAEHHAETGLLPVPWEVKILSFTPHMHVRGTAFRYEVILPNGNVRTLLDVPHYDFNWQINYAYAEPITIPVGSRLRATGWFDNSANNPANPDPTKTVHWGPQTYDEMLLGYVEYYQVNEPAPAQTAAR